MLDLLSLALSAGGIVISTYFKFKGQQSSTVKTDLNINRVVVNHDSVAINLSVSNLTSKPFSIIQVFIQQGTNLFEGCRILDVEPVDTNEGNVGFDFKTDMETYSYDNPNSIACNLEPFNIHAYLLENQSETGWLVFKMPKEAMIINKIGIKITGSEEILYATP